MEIFKKGLFGKEKLVIMGIPDTRRSETGEREVDIVLRCLPEKKFFCYESDGTKKFSSYKKSIYWID